MTGVEEACTAALRKAEYVYERNGELLPCMWAVGLHRSVHSVPMTAFAADQRPQLLLGLHSLLAHSVDAHWIGMSHEVWSHERDPDEPMPKKGDLGRLAATDPSVKTALLLHVYDIKTDEHVIGMSRLDLDRHGRPVWDSSLQESITSPVMDNLKMTAKLVREMEVDTSPEAILTVLDWTAVWTDHSEVLS